MAIEHEVSKLAQLLSEIEKDRHFSIEAYRAVRDDPYPYEDGYRHLVPGKAQYSLKSKQHSISVDHLIEIVQFLIDERTAAWLLSPEGKQQQMELLASAMHLGSTNPEFDASAAQKMAAEQIQPFKAIIKILERNGYTVTSPSNVDNAIEQP